MRIENGYDPWVHSPDNPTWVHTGHTISIMPQSQVKKPEKIGNEKGNKDNDQSNCDLVVSQRSTTTEPAPSARAFKFGDDRPDSAGGKFIGKKGKRQEKQMDHDMSSYLNAIELIHKDRYGWPNHFVGEEGSGVRGLNEENRLVC